MHWKISVFALVGVLLSLSAQAAQPPFSLGFDPARDPFDDFARAADVAKREGKLVLIEIGGDWCTWCHVMEEYLAETPAVRSALLNAFVILKVNVSEENPNTEFVSYLPEIRGVPFFVIADPDGQVVGEQETASLEQDHGYSDEAFMAFIRRWRPGGALAETTQP